MIDVKGILHALSAREQDYSVEVGEMVTGELQSDLFCEGDDVDRAVQLIQREGRTGAPDAGWTTCLRCV
ncbi:MAG: hypothetical protein WKF61_01435 [Luteimonas sp.]